jgi:F0F1-type ATP synthase delta subunit
MLARCKKKYKIKLISFVVEKFNFLNTNVVFFLLLLIFNPNISIHIYILDEFYEQYHSS